MVNSIYKKYLPFYDESLNTVSKKASVNLSKVFIPFRELDAVSYLDDIIPDVDTDEFKDKLKVLIRDIPENIQMHRVEPMGFYIPDNFTNYQLLFLNKLIDKIDYVYNDEELRNVFKISKTKNTYYIDATVTVFYYNTVVQDINVYEHNDLYKRVVYLGESGIATNFVISEKFINLALQDDVIKNINTFYMNELKGSESNYIENVINQGESISDDFDFEKAKKTNKGSIQKNISGNTIYKRVKNFISGKQKGKKSVPCLCGLSGIAKSAVVSDLAKDLGYRFVDFRAAFMHRLDMEGMFYSMDKEGNALSYDSYEEVERYSSQAPLGEFVKCSDQYMNYAASMAEKLKEVKKIDNNATEEKQKKVLNEGEEKVGDFIIKNEQEVLFYNNRNHYADIEVKGEGITVTYSDSKTKSFEDFSALKENLLDNSSAVSDSLVEISKEVESIFDNSREAELERLFDKAKEYKKYTDLWDVSKDTINTRIDELQSQIANSTDKTADKLKKRLDVYLNALAPAIKDKPDFSSPDEIKLKKQRNSSYAYDIQGNRFFAEATDERAVYNMYINERFVDSVRGINSIKQFIFEKVNKLYQDEVTNHELSIELALKSGIIEEEVKNGNIDSEFASDLITSVGEDVPQDIKVKVEQKTGSSVESQETSEEVSKDLKEDEEEDKAGVNTDHDYYPIYRQLKEKKLLKYLDTLIEKYEKASKPAVLFFDEIVRADNKILNLFTQILDTKEFNNMTFYKSKLVAAANTPHGISTDQPIEDFNDNMELFVKGDTEGDPAVFNRFSIIPVTIENVYSSFVEHMKNSKSPFHDYVFEFITKDGEEEGKKRAYNIQEALQKSDNIYQARDATYPTFRAWEKISDMLKSKDNGNKVFEKSVRGLLGDLPVTDNFIKFLKEEKGFEFDTKTESGVDVNSDPQTAMLESNMEAGVATGLFGPSGIGKTSRIQNTVDAKEGWRIQKYQMSQKSPNDVMGQPSVVNVDSYVLGDLHDKLGDDFSVLNGISKESMEEANQGGETKLPSKVTIRSPHQDIKEAFDEIRDIRKNVNPNAKLVLMFDEVNRFPEGSESVQSAVFEAISDNRFSGIDFDPDEVAVVCAANLNYEDEGEYDDEYEDKLESVYGEKPGYGAANELGSAFRLRMSSYDKKDINKSDAQAVRDFISNEKNNYNHIIQDFINNLSDEDLVLMLKSAEYKSLFDNVPAPRNFDSLSVFMDENPKLFKGAWFFPSAGDLDNARTLGTFGGTDELSTVYENLNQPYVHKHWIVLGEDIETGIDGMNTPKDVIEAVQYVINNKGDSEVDEFSKKLHNLIIDIEFNLREDKKAMLSDYLGSESTLQELGLDTLNGLLDRNNLVESGVVTDFRSVKDEDSADAWLSYVVKQEYRIDTLFSEYIDKAINHFIESGNYENLIFIIISAIKRLDETRAKAFLEKLVNNYDVFERMDSLFSQYNERIVEAVKNTTYGSFGTYFDKLAKNVKK